MNKRTYKSTLTNKCAGTVVNNVVKIRVNKCAKGTPVIAMAIVLMLFGVVVVLASAQLIAAQADPPESLPEGNETSQNQTVPPADEPAVPEQQDEEEEEEKEEPVYAVDLLEIFPEKVDVGDTQLNLYVKNTGNQDLENLAALITGNGISTYSVVPIERLEPNQKSYIIAQINAKQSVSINLEIHIFDETFTKKLLVRQPEEEIQASQQQQEEERRRQRLVAFGEQLANLTGRYDELEEFYYEKKNMGFDLSGLDLKDAKTYLRNAQASYSRADAEGTEANLILLETEINDIRALLERTQKPKRSFSVWFKDNSTFVITFGYILGIIISLFTIIELVKKNKASIGQQKNIKLKTPLHERIAEEKEAMKKLMERSFISKQKIEKQRKAITLAKKAKNRSTSHGASDHSSKQKKSTDQSPHKTQRSQKIQKTKQPQKTSSQLHKMRESKSSKKYKINPAAANAAKYLIDAGDDFP